MGMATKRLHVNVFIAFRMALNICLEHSYASVVSWVLDKNIRSFRREEYYRTINTHTNATHPTQLAVYLACVGCRRCRRCRCDLWMAETIDEYRWGDEAMSLLGRDPPSIVNIKWKHFAHWTSPPAHMHGISCGIRKGAEHKRKKFPLYAHELNIVSLHLPPFASIDFDIRGGWWVAHCPAV